ncbi:MAG: hypothetical protein L6Q99_21690 [Planctomycetes bacterium]|nr:hypothetical protein [Planctomycetota bacterium]
MNDLPDAQYAWQIVVTDPNNLSGASVAAMLQNVADLCGAEHVMVLRAQGAGEGIPGQLARARATGSDVAAQVARRVRDFTQLDWADFALFSSRQPFDPGLSSYSYAVSTCKVLLRCVDDEYFYVYGRDRAALGALTSVLANVQVKECSLGELEFPY